MYAWMDGWMEKTYLKTLYGDDLQILSHSVKTVSLTRNTFNDSHVPYLCPCFDLHNPTIGLFFTSLFFPSAKVELLNSLYRALAFYNKDYGYFYTFLFSSP